MIRYAKEILGKNIYDEEMLAILLLLNAAIEYEQATEEYLIPSAYWTDKQGKLYIRWNIRDKEVEKPVCRYWSDENKGSVKEVISIKMSK